MAFNKSSQIIVAKSVYNVYVMVLYFFMNLYKRFFPIDAVAPVPIIKDPIDQYINMQKDRFVNKSLNESIDDVFYSKKEYLELLENLDNYLEKKWKKNILFEHTPRGNIIMHYDVFKQGFAYYCDTSGVGYDILNAVAMRYVYVFRCRDFFIDQNILYENKESPLIKIYFTEEKSNKTKKESFLKEGAPFAKFKNYSTNDNKEPNGNTKPVVEKIRNKFVNLGKICNFNMLQTLPKKNAINGFKSKMLDALSGETQLQKEVLSYKNYKLRSGKL
jgi:hypothetical protein